MMHRMPNATDLTPEEFASLARVCRRFICATIPKAHQTRLVELGLIQAMMGGLLTTPLGRMVASPRSFASAGILSLLNRSLLASARKFLSSRNEKMCPKQHRAG